MFNVKVDYPDEEDEFRIVESTTRPNRPTIDRVVNADELLSMQAVVLQVPVAEHVIRYAMRLTRKTRPDADDAPDFVRNYVTWGAGPRASQFLVLASKARALLYGRPYVATEDIRAVAAPVLRHRLITNFNAEADGVKPDDIVGRLIEGTPVER